MDKRQLFTAIALTCVVIGTWLLVVGWVDKHYPAPPPSQATTQPTTTTSQEASTEPTTTPATTMTAVASATTAPTTSPTGLHAIESDTPGSIEPTTLGAADTKRFAIQLYLTPHGAGIQKAILDDFKQEVHSAQRYTFQEPYEDHPGTEPMATQSISIDGDSIDLMGAPWKRTALTDSSATYQVTIARGSTPICTITKTFTISPRTDPNQGYEVKIDQTVQSLADHPLKVQQTINGPTSLPREIERGGDLSVMSGYIQPHSAIDVTQEVLESSKFKDGAIVDLTNDSGKTHHAAWSGQVSTYFNALVLPNIGQYGQGFSVSAQALEPTKADREVIMTFATDAVEVQPHQQAAVPMTVYLGPKSREILKNKNGFFEQFPRMYNLTLVMRSGMCAFCTWNWLVDWLFAILWFFHAIFRDWGVAIICLVVLVRLLLHPLTKAGQVQMMKMQKYGPEIEKLKKKYGEDKDGLNKEMMKFYKEQGYGLGPMLGCAPMFLQTPIWIALWSALQSTFELRQAPFLYGLTWIKDLAKPDNLIHLSHPISVLGYFDIWGLNVLPILMAVATYFNQKYFMPTPVAMTPEQQQQQKMTRGMSLIFPLMFYSLPSGLNIYYVTSMTLGIVESKRIRDHIKEREEAEKAGRVFVETKATRGARNRNEPTAAPEKPGIMGKFFAKLAEIQNQVEKMRDEQDKGKNKGRNQ